MFALITCHTRWSSFALLFLVALALGAQAAAEIVALPAVPHLTPAGYALILEFETGGVNNYNPYPLWPGGASGVTIGVGYDVGYQARDVVLSDWQQLGERRRIADLAGKTGSQARWAVTSVEDIQVHWGLAVEVFDTVTLARWSQICQRTFPGFAALHPNAQAALLSLVLNRGNSLAGPQRAEMRAIRDLVPERDYRGIAVQLWKMTRIWRGTSLARGMIRRRQAEAALVETALHGPLPESH